MKINTTHKGQEYTIEIFGWEYEEELEKMAIYCDCVNYGTLEEILANNYEELTMRVEEAQEERDQDMKLESQIEAHNGKY